MFFLVPQEQYVFIHDAILEACLCGETAVPVNEFALTYKEMLKVDTQSNTSQLREEFQVLALALPSFESLFFRRAKTRSLAVARLARQFSTPRLTPLSRFLHEKQIKKITLCLAATVV